jgi:NAD(P)-dependent dehydrogenase (short-subunit alcohol dehydrogenase family)
LADQRHAPSPKTERESWRIPGGAAKKLNHWCPRFAAGAAGICGTGAPPVDGSEESPAEVSLGKAKSGYLALQFERRRCIQWLGHAGISKSVPIEGLTVEDFDRLFAVNVRAPYFLVQQLLVPIPASDSRCLYRHSSKLRRRTGELICVQ